MKTYEMGNSQAFICMSKGGGDRPDILSREDAWDKAHRVDGRAAKLGGAGDGRRWGVSGTLARFPRLQGFNVNNTTMNST